MTEMIQVHTVIKATKVIQAMKDMETQEPKASAEAPKVTADIEVIADIEAIVEVIEVENDRIAFQMILLETCKVTFKVMDNITNNNIIDTMIGYTAEKTTALVLLHLSMHQNDQEHGKVSLQTISQFKKCGVVSPIQLHGGVSVPQHCLHLLCAPLYYCTLNRH